MGKQDVLFILILRLQILSSAGAYESKKKLDIVKTEKGSFVKSENVIKRQKHKLAPQG